MLILVVAGGCAPRPGPEVLSVVPVGPVAAEPVTIHVATTRQRDATGGYSDARSPVLSFEDFTISIPPDHRITRIEWPKAEPDPANSFAVTERRVRTSLEMSAPRPRDVVIFVHGYNHNFAESLFRLAQIAPTQTSRRRRSSSHGRPPRSWPAMSPTETP